MTTRTGRSAPGTTRRAQLTAIAATLFARDGYHNVTVGDIAAAAGLSGPAIYRHFPGKQAILAEVVRSGFDEMARALAADLATTTDPADRLRTTYRDLASFVIRRPEFGVMWRREHRHLAPTDAADLAHRMTAASTATVTEILRLRPTLPAPDAELLSWAALSILGSISDHGVRLPRAAFEELLASMAMDAVSTEFDPDEANNRPQSPPISEGRREQILTAAARLFWDRGYHAVTLEEIGAAAGIAGPSIYSHFTGKTDLLQTITERIGDRLRLTLVAEGAEVGGGDGVGDSGVEPSRTAFANSDTSAAGAPEGSGLADGAGTDRSATAEAASTDNLQAGTAALTNSAPTASFAADAPGSALADSSGAAVPTAATGSALADSAAACLSAEANSADKTGGSAGSAGPALADSAALSSAAAQAALTTLVTRYIATVLASRDLVAAYFTEGHNLPDRDRAETRRFQRVYTAHWAAFSPLLVPVCRRPRCGFGCWRRSRSSTTRCGRGG
ncbi:TetR/AcrR family transcriptional regulator [Catenulispora yoronensis]